VMGITLLYWFDRFCHYPEGTGRVYWVGPCDRQCNRHVLTLSNWILRVGNPLESVVPVGISLSIATALVLVVTGWMGGELTFRSAIGVTGHGREVVHAGTKEGGSG
jgi:hypothetical protein